MAEWYFPTAFSSWGEEEKEAIARVHASGRYTMGEECEAFEEEFAYHHGMKFGIMVNSGSSANLIGIAALIESERLSQGDRVLVPGLAWATTYAPLWQHDLQIRLMDCDGTWCAKPSREILDGIDLVIDVPVLGQPTYGKIWSAFCAGQQIPLMVDCCESLGAWMGPYGERVLAGTTGIVNTFSFFYSHQLSAIEGGMILTNDEELADLMRMLRNHGLAKPPHKASSFDEQYDFRLFGYNVRPLELHAAIAREQLKKLEMFRRHREQNLNNFATWCIGLPIQIQGKLHGTVPSPFGLPFTVESKQTRAKLVEAFKENGIDCRMPTGGSFRKHFYGKPWADQQTPECDRIHDTGMFLGNAPWDISEQIQRAVNVMKEVL